MSYGEPTRTAVSDANANRVDKEPPQATRRKVRAQGIESPKRLDPNLDDEKFLIEQADTLGNKIQTFAAKKNEEARASKELAGAMRQGRAKGINDIAQMSKRTGLSEFFLGQDADYVGAQRRAVENNIVEWSNFELSSVEQHAGMSPEDYEARILSKYEEHAENFEGDPKSLAMLQKMYGKASEQLMAAHTKERYAHTITQNEMTHRQRIQQNTDTMVLLDNKYGETPEEQETNLSMWEDHYDYEFQMGQLEEHQRFLPEKFQSMHVENIVEQLNADNINAFAAAERVGFLGTLPRSTQEAVKGAHTRYENRKNGQAFIEKADQRTLAENWKTSEDEIVARVMAGTEKYPNIIKAEQLDELLLANRRAKEAEQIRREKAAAGAGKTVGDKHNALRNVILHKGGHGAPRNDADNKTKVYQDNISLNARGNNSAFNIDDAEIGHDSFVYLIQNNPEFTENAAKNLISADFITPMEESAIKNLLPDLLGNSANIADETGQLTDEARMRLDNIYKYEKYHPNLFAKVLGDDYLKLELFKNLVQQRRPVQDISELMDQWKRGETNEFFQNPARNKDGTRKVTGLSREAGLRNEFEKLLGHPYASPLAFKDYNDKYEMSLAVTGDSKKAVQMANSFWAADNETAMGKAIIGGRALQENMNSFVNTTPVLTVSPEDTRLYSMMASDPNKGGKGDFTVETNAAKIDDVLDWASESGMLNSLWHDLGVQPNKDTMLFDRDALETHAIDMEVHHGDNRLMFRSAGGVQQYVSFDVMTNLHKQYSLYVYEKQRRAEIDAERSIRVDEKLGQKSRIGGRTLNIPKGL